MDNQGIVAPLLDGARDLSLHQSVQASSRAHPTSYSMGSRGSLPSNKVARARSWSFTYI